MGKECLVGVSDGGDELYFFANKGAGVGVNYFKLVDLRIVR